MVKAQLEGKGLSAAEQIYEERSLRAKELRYEGKKIMGYFCAYPPLEMLTAADLVPYRIMGNPRQSIVKADAYLESIMCSFVRSCFDTALNGSYDFLDGFIGGFACDNIWKIYGIWQHNFNLSFSHYLNIPNTTSPASLKFFREELETLRKHLEQFTNREINNQRLLEAIKLHNENRALMRNIYMLRKPDPPLLSAVEMNKILFAAISIPVEESNQLLRDVILDLEKRNSGPPKQKARILVVGPEIDDSPLFELIEESGANVVADDICIGTRIYWQDVEIEGDPLDNLVTRYLEKVTCPRTYRERTGSREDDLNNRFGHIRDIAHDFNVNGVVLYILRYCDNFGFDVPDMKDYLEKAGLPVLHIEDDYFVNKARLKTRIEAFLEMIN